jgi:hypothetical protein
MTTLTVLVLSTVELSRPLRAKGVDGIEHDLRTVGDAARFLWANFSIKRKDSLAWRHAVMCLEEAAIARDEEHARAATIAVEVLLNEDELLKE